MSKHLLRSILSFFFFSQLVACKLDNALKQETYSYNLTSNGCSTGEKSFSSLEGYCSSLKDDLANNGCARDMRRERFIGAGCPGDFDNIVN